MPTALLPLKVGCRSVELIKKVQRVAFDFNVREQGHETSLELLVELHITGQGEAHQQSDLIAVSRADTASHRLPCSLGENCRMMNRRGMVYVLCKTCKGC